VAPAILVSEIEIEKKAKANDRPPLLSEPTSMETNQGGAKLKVGHALACQPAERPAVPGD
jgi:hypothetical protein